MLADFDKAVDCGLNLLLGVGGAELDPDAGLVFGYHWIAEADDENILFHELFGHAGCNFGIT